MSCVYCENTLEKEKHYFSFLENLKKGGGIKARERVEGR